MRSFSAASRASSARASASAWLLADDLKNAERHDRDDRDRHRRDGAPGVAEVVVPGGDRGRHDSAATASARTIGAARRAEANHAAIAARIHAHHERRRPRERHLRDEQREADRRRASRSASAPSGPPATRSEISDGERDEDRVAGDRGTAVVCWSPPTGDVAPGRRGRLRAARTGATPASTGARWPSNPRAARPSASTAVPIYRPIRGRPLRPGSCRGGSPNRRAGRARRSRRRSRSTPRPATRRRRPLSSPPARASTRAAP